MERISRNDFGAKGNNVKKLLHVTFAWEYGRNFWGRHP